MDDTQTYKFGNEFQSYLGLSDRYALGSLLIDPLAMFRLRFVTEDIVNGLPLPNTGGFFVHFVPGVLLLPHPDFSIRISAELPMFRYVQGTQLATSQKVTLGLFFKISTKKSELLLLEP